MAGGAQYSHESKGCSQTRPNWCVPHARTVSCDTMDPETRLFEVESTIMHVFVTVMLLIDCGVGLWVRYIWPPVPTPTPVAQVESLPNNAAQKITGCRIWSIHLKVTIIISRGFERDKVDLGAVVLELNTHNDMRR